MLTTTLLEAAKAGAAEIVRYFNRDFKISTKEGVNNLVTEADHASEKAIIAVIKSAYPDHFIYSKAWATHKDVIAAMRKASVVVSDSGGFQEEANIVGVPHVTVRFGSDRSELFFAGSNIPAPPISTEFIYEVIKGAYNNKAMASVPNQYGTEVAHKIVDGVLARLHADTGLLMTEEQRLGFE